MIELETVARIRQLYYGEHWRVGTIAAELGLHHETVERALRDETQAKCRYSRARDHFRQIIHEHSPTWGRVIHEDSPTPCA